MADDPTHRDEPADPPTPVDLLLPGAWRSSRSSQKASPDPAARTAPDSRRPATLPLPLGELFDTDLPDGSDAGADGDDADDVEGSSDDGGSSDEEPARPGTTAHDDNQPALAEASFWGEQLRIPIIREPSPVLGPSMPAVVEPVVERVVEPVVEPVAQPAEPVVEPVAQPAEPVAQPSAEPVDPVVEHVVEPAGPAAAPAPPTPSPRRLRPVVALALAAASLAGVAVLLATVPGLLPGRTTSAVLPAEAASSAPGAPASVPVTTAPNLQDVVATRPAESAQPSATRTTRSGTAATDSEAPRRRTPRTGTTTRPESPSVTTRPRGDSSSDLPGQVFVDPDRYLGRPEGEVRDELEAQDLRVRSRASDGSDAEPGTVIDIRPAGWVRAGFTVNIYVLP